MLQKRNDVISYVQARVFTRYFRYDLAYIINLNVYLLRTQIRRCERNSSTDITIHRKIIICLCVLLNNIPGITRFSLKICVSKLNLYLVSRTSLLKEELLR